MLKYFQRLFSPPLKQSLCYDCALFLDEKTDSFCAGSVAISRVCDRYNLSAPVIKCKNFKRG